MKISKQSGMIQRVVSMKAKAFAFMFTMGAAVLLALMPANAGAKVSVATIFGSHMVLQQNMDVPVWGNAEAGEEVTVSFADQSVKTKADADGKWMVKLAALKATKDQKGQVLTVTGSNTITFEDVLIGEVWLCSGQSNMAWNLGGAANGKEEIAQANYPQIRQLSVGQQHDARQPLDKAVGNWRVCHPDAAISYSAVAYFFGRQLHKDLDVPVGLIRSAVGGTKAEAWTSGDAIMKHMPEYANDYTQMVYPGEMFEKKLDDFNAQLSTYKAKTAALIEQEADAAAAARYATVDFDDSEWKKMDLPGPWDSKGLKGYEGMVWFRKRIDVPAEWAGKDLILNLASINAADVAWFNGKLVGKTGSAAQNLANRKSNPRVYRVSGENVKAGENVIAVRVTSSLRWGAAFSASGKIQFNVMLADVPAKNSDAVSLAGDWRYLPVFEIGLPPEEPANKNRPSVLFNGMIHPLIPYAMRGAIWYQGESNSGNHKIYTRLLTTLITDWRTRWGQGDIPFIIVQLPNYRARASTPESDSWTLLREAQADVARTVPNVGLAVTLDIGEAGDIHPKNKQDVGKRLALIAEANTYGMDVVHSGPTMKSFKIQGSEVHVSYDNVHGGLVLKGDKLEGFGLQDKDGKWVWADARIQGDQVIVSSDKIKEPVGVSYAWTANPPSTLYNKAGLPAAQFKSDAKK